MSLTGSELVDEIQTLVGRVSTDPLVDDTRCTRWLNEAQREIADACPGLKTLTFKNTTSIDTTQKLQYDLTDITFGDSTRCQLNRVFEIFYLDGNESVHLNFTHVDEFDKEWPDPTHSDYSPDKPNRWTRRGNKIEIFPLSACSYCNKDLRFNGDFYAEDFTTNDTDTSDISNADDGLIFYATGEAWDVIGGETGNAESLKYKAKFLNWLENYKTKNETLYEWDGNQFGDALE